MSDDRPTVKLDVGLHPPPYSQASAAYGHPLAADHRGPLVAPHQTLHVALPAATPTHVVLAASFGATAVNMTCPHCSNNIITVTEYKVGAFAWVVCLVLVLFGLVLGCCLIPFCVHSCKDCVHSCPHCRRELGRFKRI